MFNFIFTPLAVLLIIWEVIWKGISLWKCGRNNQLVWFVLILLLNTLGILPIIYLLFFQRNKSLRKNK
ncbi:MAG: DUF5652 family protein [Candidatus Pacearchaeota archaeon]